MRSKLFGRLMSFTLSATVALTSGIPSLAYDGGGGDLPEEDEYKSDTKKQDEEGLGCSWGGFESLAIMPLGGATDEAAAEMGGARNLVRLYIGQEDAEDLWKDLEQALSVI